MFMITTRRATTAILAGFFFVATVATAALAGGHGAGGHGNAGRDGAKAQTGDELRKRVRSEVSEHTRSGMPKDAGRMTAAEVRTRVQAEGYDDGDIEHGAALYRVRVRDRDGLPAALDAQYGITKGSSSNE